MNAILLTVLALGANGNAYYAGGPETQAPASVYSGGGCDECGDACGGCGNGNRRGSNGVGRTPPQTCYDPAFGCYTSSRHMHRYPAFHGTFYRQAYNYRNYFDYPWHAGLHEPTSHFSYHVPGEAQVEAVPTPNAEPAAARPLRNEMRAALNQTSVTDRRPTPAQSLRTLRR